MPGRQRIFMASFNRDAEFEVNRIFLFDRARFVPGETFDKSKVTTRRLRTLYETRKIRMVEGTVPFRPSALSALNAAQHKASGARPVDKAMPGAERAVVADVAPPPEPRDPNGSPDARPVATSDRAATARAPAAAKKPAGGSKSKKRKKKRKP